MIIQGPCASGYETGIWTGPLVANLVKREFNVEYSVTQVRRILHELGFSVQYPKKLSRADHALQEKWINETLPHIFEEAERANGVVLFEDEAIFQQAGTMSRTWAPEGKGTEMISEPCRESVKVFGAVNVTNVDKPGFHFCFQDVFNAETFVKFVNQLTRYYEERKIFLILDNALYHRAKAVQEWQSKFQERISFCFLPPYSPELNATEYVWRATKRKATHNIYFKTKTELHDKLFRRFNRFQGNPRSLKTTVGSFSLKKAV